MILMRNSRTMSMLAVSAFCVFVGAGCGSVADQLADDAIKPISVPVQALGDAKRAAAEIDARTNEDAERESDDVSVAMVMTSGSDALAAADPDTIGCGDTIVFKKLHRAASTGQVVPDALATLFGQKQSTVDSAYNALWQSSLAVEKVLSTDGVTTEVWLRGAVLSGGVCDDPRIKAQVERTIARFRTKYKVILNGSEANWRCLGDQSGECK